MLLKDMEPIVRKFYEGVAEGKYLGRRCKECGPCVFSYEGRHSTQNLLIIL